MCFFGLASWIGDRIRQAIACLCLIACAGPILIIVGGIALTAHNTRQSEITSWTNAISVFDATVVPVLRSTTAVLGTTNMSLEAMTVQVHGNLDSVPSSVTSLPFVTFTAPSSSWSFATTINGSPSSASNVTLNGIVTTKTTKSNVYCTYNYCTSGCSGSSSYYYCRNIAGTACSDGAFSGLTSCYGDDGICGTCTRTKYQSGVCAPMTLTNVSGGQQMWQLAAMKRSCDYPFTEQQQGYTASPRASVTVKLMSEQDPYITLSGITSGDNDFGITAGSQHNMGKNLLIVGIVISIAVYGIIGVLMYRCCFRGPQVVVDAGYVPVTQPGMMQQQPQYTVYSGQQYPQPAYGQPAPYPVPIQQPYGAPPPQPYGYTV